MKKRSIGLIIGLMGFALLGVMAMQLYFLRQSYQMQSELFDRSVNEALNNVVSKVSKQDAVNFLNNKAQRSVAAPSDDVVNVNAGIREVKTGDNGQYAFKKKKQSIREKKIALLRDSLERMIMHKKMDDELASLLQQEGTVDFQVRVEEYTDEFGVVHGRFTPQIVRTRITRTLNRPKKLHKYDTLRYVYMDPQFGKQLISVPQINPLWQQDQIRRQKERQVTQIKKMLETDSLQNLNSGKTTVIENLAEEYRKTGEP